MRGILLTLLALTCMAAAQSASPQQPASMAASAVSSTNTTNTAAELESPNGSSTATVDADPAVATPMAVPAPPIDQKDAKAKTAPSDPDDQNKSPYWDPKDWTYIYNQGP
jgi:hypothetical protein